LPIDDAAPPIPIGDRPDLLEGGAKVVSARRRGPGSKSPSGFEYGSDLHWLLGWYTRIDARVADDKKGFDQLEGWIFRPSENARNAMMRLSIKYPVIIKQVDEFLVHAERMFSEALQDFDADAIHGFYAAIFELARRIEAGIDAIARSQVSERAQSQVKINEKSAPKWTPDSKTRKIIKRMKRGDTNDQIMDSLGAEVCVSAANLRTIRSRAKGAGLL
jgi:hypothetical protein